MINKFIDSSAYETADIEQFVYSETSSLFHQIPISEAANYRIMQIPRDFTNQAKMAEVLMSLPPLGLKLHKPASFMNLIETRLFPEERPNLITEINPKKASNADIFLLRIGTWQRVAQNKEGLVAKCYFAKRKLMWEILENGLKRKIQMHWEHVLAIRAEIQEDKPGILEIELSQPPSFFRETEPQPRKHTLWDNASDFTGGQAMICRRHYLQFPPGALNKLYEKLLQCEPRFFEMSQMPFPSFRSPFFDSNLFNTDGYGDISFGCNANGVEAYSDGFIQQTPYSSVRTPLLRSVKAQHCQDQYRMVCDQSSVPSCDFSPTSVMDLSQPLEEHFSTANVPMPNMAHWGHHVDNYREIEQIDALHHQFSTAFSVMSQESFTASDQNCGLRQVGDELVLDGSHSLAMMDNESQFQNFAGVEVEMYSSNSEQESIGSENTGCRFYPQYANWVEAEDELSYTNCGPNQTMTRFLGNQNSMCPWM